VGLLCTQTWRVRLADPDSRATRK